MNSSMSRLRGVEKPGLSFAALVFAAVRRRFGRVVRPLRIHALNAPVLRGYAFMESGQDTAKSVPTHLKKLAQVRTATRIGCPF